MDAERGREGKELGEEGQRRGREVMETDRAIARGIGMPQGEMKRRKGKNNKRVGKMEKVFNR